MIVRMERLGMLHELDFYYRYQSLVNCARNKILNGLAAVVIDHTRNVLNDSQH